MVSTLYVHFYVTIVIALSFSVSSKKQDVLACEALQNAQFDQDYLSTCGVLPDDMLRCQKLTCSNADSSRLISTLSMSSVMCGGSDDRTPGILITITDFSGQILLRKTLYSTENVTIGPNKMMLTMVVTTESFGIYFEVLQAHTKKAQP